MDKLPYGYVQCSNCSQKTPAKEDGICPDCNCQVVCPLCTYCHECQILVTDMQICGCGGVVDDATGLCKKCSDTE